MSSAKIVIVGSLVVDHYFRVDAFPRPGETILTDTLEMKFGGKGANQAVAAARLGARVDMIGCVGDDENGRAYRERLADFAIGVSGLETVSGSTGSAFITLDLAGENTIVVAAAANLALSPEIVRENKALIADADYLLLQNEIPHASNVAAAKIAHAAGTQVVYNPAPWNTEIDPGEVRANFLIVNEIEVADLLGEPLHCVDQLLDGTIVTRGSDATLACIGGKHYSEKPAAICPVDTVGAGDTFCGAFACQLAAGGEFPEVLSYANRAAGLSTLAFGAQEAMPSAADLSGA